MSEQKKPKYIQAVAHIASTCNGVINDPLQADLEGGCCATRRRIDKENKRIQHLIQGWRC